MASSLSQLRHAPRLVRGTTRLISNSSITRAEVPLSSNIGVVSPQKRPIGGFRGSLFGFLLGFSAASAYASYYLLDEYRLASTALQISIEELQSSTQQVSQHIRRIEALEKELKALSESAAGRDEVSRVRVEMKKLYDGLHIEFLDIKSHIWGIQQDLHSLSKKEGTSIRVSQQ